MKTLILTLVLLIQIIAVNAQNINLTLPENGGQLVLGGSKNFKWEAPDNLVENQKYIYYFKIVKIDLSDNPNDAIIEHQPYVEYVTDSLTATTEYIINLDSIYFATAQHFAWQVKAFTNDTLVAQSSVNTFEGPLLCYYFKSDKRRIYATKFTRADADWDTISGMGYISTRGKRVDVMFEKIKIERSGAEIFMRRGEVNGSFKDTLNLSIYDVHGLLPTTLYIDSLIIYPYGTERVKCKSIVLQEFNDDTIRSNVNGWVRYSQDSDNILGSINFSDTVKLNNKIFEFSNSSNIYINSSRYKPSYYGKIKYLHNDDTLTINIPDNSNELDYISSNSGGSVKLDEQISISTSSCVFDFSDDLSPGVFQDSLEWKGVYLNNFKFDQIEKEDTFNFKISNNYIATSKKSDSEWLGYISENSLKISADTVFETPIRGEYNYFIAYYDTIKINNLNENLEGKVSGKISIPYLKDSPFHFIIPCVNGDVLLAETDTACEFQVFPLSEFAFYSFGVIVDDVKYAGEIDHENKKVVVKIPEFNGTKYFKPYFKIAGHKFSFHFNSIVSESSEQYLNTEREYVLDVISFDNRQIRYILNFEVEETTGYGDPFQIESIKAFPNPVYDYLELSGLNKNTIISVLDINGCALINKNSNNKKEIINMKELKSGIYIVKITDNERTINKKIIKK